MKICVRRKTYEKFEIVKLKSHCLFEIRLSYRSKGVGCDNFGPEMISIRREIGLIKSAKQASETKLSSEKAKEVCPCKGLELLTQLILRLLIKFKKF